MMDGRRRKRRLRCRRNRKEKSSPGKSRSNLKISIEEIQSDLGFLSFAKRKEEVGRDKASFDERKR